MSDECGFLSWSYWYGDHRDGWADGVLDGDPPDFLRPGYGEISPDGTGHYDVIMVADDDQVRLEHAVDLYRSLPDAELSVVPGTSHGLLAEKQGLCNMVITEFCTKDPVPTFAPIRRASR